MKADILKSLMPFGSGDIARANDIIDEAQIQENDVRVSSLTIATQRKRL